MRPGKRILGKVSRNDDADEDGDDGDGGCEDDDDDAEGCVGVMVEVMVMDSIHRQYGRDRQTHN